jgi:hypothetical protein
MKISRTYLMFASRDRVNVGYSFCRTYNRDQARIVGMCGEDNMAQLIEIGYQVNTVREQKLLNKKEISVCTSVCVSIIYISSKDT